MGNYGVKYNAALALGALGCSKAVKSLVKKLEDPDAEFKADIAIALGEIGDSKAIEPLTSLLQDPSERVRNAAEKALDKLNLNL